MLIARVLVVLFLFLAATASSCTHVPPSSQSVWAWGSNEVGQIGDGFQSIASDRPRPVRLPLSDVTRIAAGYRHSLALKSDGSVWQWGSMEKRSYASEGFCKDETEGLGHITCDVRPTMVSGVANARLIGAGRDFALAVVERL